MKKLLLIMFIGVLSSGCQIVEKPDPPLSETTIDDELLPYYETFLNEREKLGHIVPLPHIKIELVEVEKATWRGKCSWHKEQGFGNDYYTEKTITINKIPVSYTHLTLPTTPYV